jgi:hypothetical protein
MENATIVQYFRLYGKGPGMRTFKAMDLKRGAPVGNLIYATIMEHEKAQRVLEEVTRVNTDWSFRLEST